MSIIEAFIELSCIIDVTACDVKIYQIISCKIVCRINLLGITINSKRVVAVNSWNSKLTAICYLGVLLSVFIHKISFNAYQVVDNLNLQVSCIEAFRSKVV